MYGSNILGRTRSSRGHMPTAAAVYDEGQQLGSETTKRLEIQPPSVNPDIVCLEKVDELFSSLDQGAL